MKATYAVLWCGGEAVESGRLEPRTEGLELRGRNRALSIDFTEVTGAAIARGADQRLRGLPVLSLLLRGGTALRIASLEGSGALHELAECIERAAGLSSAA
ncbi:MAG TPA: hypothetical protein VGJ77_22875 [Gaiellaceae bacterium]|jgi:hypothetical protein